MSNHKKKHYFLIAWLILSFGGCQKDKPSFFKKISAEKTGITFVNTIQENEQYNMIDYSYLYNGGGVGTGDINNDGLVDIFFTSNQGSSELYLNQGNLNGASLRFENITKQAHIVTKGWCTGVTFVDINADGFLDIYVCKSGNCPESERENLLFINDGVKNGKWTGTFTEKAKEYGINNNGWSSQAAFFDFDKDGDLDLYVLNATNDDRQPNRIKESRILDGSSSANDAFYRNDNGKFTEIHQIAGIVDDGWGLGLSVGDLNNDGWEDLYISNDFLANDLVYINNQKGGFIEQSQKILTHSSHFSMGNDIADVNNDGWQDIVVADMMPSTNQQRKKMAGTLSNDAFNLVVQNGYLPQYMRNTLQLNNGSGLPFSEIGMMAGVFATDWSWSPLLADFDNDGWKDLFISNGYRHDITDMDFITDNAQLGQKMPLYNADKIIKENAKKQPEYKTNNRFFRNTGNIGFEDITEHIDQNEPSFSNGATYSDLDNDGDLDIITNNIDDVASIYENKGSFNNYLQISLTESSQNRFALGAKVTVFHQNKHQTFQHTVTKGYLSCKDYRIQIGLGQDLQADSLQIIWTDGSYQTLKKIKANQHLTIHKASKLSSETNLKPLVTPFFTQDFPYQSPEEKYDDFALEPLLPHRFSTEGPTMTSGDVNGDKLTDFFVAGSLEKTGTFFMQKQNGTFEQKALKSNIPLGDGGDCLLFDADNDHDLDLYIASGGDEFEINSRFYQDQLFINDGKGNFNLATDRIPSINTPSSCVIACDYDHDGDNDLFVGGRRTIMKYGEAGTSFLFQNNHGKFNDVTPPQLKNIGMITSATWVDIDQDSWQDLVISGELMPILAMKNNRGKFTETPLKVAESGFWHKIEAADFDKDGDLDFLAGNLGLNHKYGISDNTPYRVYIHDFDGNNYFDPITTYYVQGKEYPSATRDELMKQLPFLRKKLTHYADYSKATLKDIFDESLLE
ncbi:MAG: VCBS repeat-containing protein, partial [Arcicella sp.]|nr:VCBS repeat-containing protein [Arcicella sp.]